MLKSRQSSDIMLLLSSLGIKCQVGSYNKLTHIRCGGSIGVVAYPSSEEQLLSVVAVVRQYKLPYYVLGLGSKTLASDSNFEGIVICTRLMRGITITDTTCEVLAGTSTVVLANALAEKGLSGAEYMYCLPATVGGAVVMNAGCYGQCSSEIVDSVRCYDTFTNRMVTLSKQQCQFGHRTSIFKSGRYIITIIRMLLHKFDKCSIIEYMHDIFARKKASQPLGEFSLGSSFISSGVAVSRLIDQAGLKGLTVGGAMVSTKHAGFIVNYNGATCRDVDMLLTEIEEAIFSKYNAKLVREIVSIVPRRMYDIRGLSHTHEE